MFEEGELSIAPVYQRKYRWTPTVASTFIESLFLGLPIPPIFVATNENFQWEVVDGVQRISTLITFMAPSLNSLSRIGRSKPLKLEGLTKVSELNGSTFEDLPTALQRYISRQPLQLISLTDKSNREVRYDLFERLNSGAISLTPQEVRSAVYRGEFIEFVENLAKHPVLTSLLKLKAINQNDGTAAEQVLKFFAYKNARNEFTGAVTSFLNDYMVTASRSFDFIKEREIFEKSVRLLSDSLDGKPFLRSKTSVTPLVQFEACVVAIGIMIEKNDAVDQPSGNWPDDPELVASSTGGSNTKAMLKRRLDRATTLFSADGD